MAHLVLYCFDCMSSNSLYYSLNPYCAVLQDLVLVYMIVCVFGLIAYVPFNIFSIMLGWVFMCLTSTKQSIKCLAQGHNSVPQMRLEPAT